MKLTITSLRSITLLATAAVGLCAGPAFAQPAVKLPPQTQYEAEEIPPPAAEGEPAAKPAVRYWIGVMCHAVDDALRTHLRLPEGQGLLVADVVPGGPAAGVGIARHDILLTAGGQPLATPKDLVAAVTASSDKPLGIILVRGGEHLSVDVTPAARPARGVQRAVIAPGEQQDLEAWAQDLLRQVEERRANPEPRRPLRFRFLNPDGQGGPPITIPLPDGASVTIIREGNQPMRLRVKQGDEEFEIAGRDLENGKAGTLPERIRPHIRPMLEHFLNGGDFQGLFNGAKKAATTENDAETEAMIPEIDIPGLEEVPAEEVYGDETEGEALPAVEIPAVDEETDDAPAREADAHSDAVGEAGEDTTAKTVAGEIRRVLPEATAEDADIEAAIMELQERLQEVRKRRQERRAQRAANKKAAAEQKTKKKDSEKDADDSEGSI